MSRQDLLALVLTVSVVVTEIKESRNTYVTTHTVTWHFRSPLLQATQPHITYYHPRATQNGWQTYEVVPAEYFSSDTNLGRDHFSFTLPIDEFAVYYMVEGKLYWNSNSLKNLKKQLFMKNFISIIQCLFYIHGGYCNVLCTDTPNTSALKFKNQIRAEMLFIFLYIIFIHPTVSTLHYHVNI